jgi:hypothetical protein
MQAEVWTVEGSGSRFLRLRSLLSRLFHPLQSIREARTQRQVQLYDPADTSWVVAVTPAEQPVRLDADKPAAVATMPAPTVAVDNTGATDALDEVNAARAARGLPPYVRDDALTLAAKQAAAFRAGRLCAGHTADDFTFLPFRSAAQAAGCAAWAPSMGWGACATYDSYSHAGAAWAVGADGRRYMHLYVTGGADTTNGFWNFTWRERRFMRRGR